MKRAYLVGAAVESGKDKTPGWRAGVYIARDGEEAAMMFHRDLRKEIDVVPGIDVVKALSDECIKEIKAL